MLRMIYDFICEEEVSLLGSMKCQRCSRSRSSQLHGLHHHSPLRLTDLSARGHDKIAATVHRIALNPDAVVVLKASTTRFAVWETANETKTTVKNTESDAKDEESKTAEATVSISPAERLLRVICATTLNGVRVSDQGEASQNPAYETTGDKNTAEEVICDDTASDSHPTPPPSTPAAECGDDPDIFRLAVCPLTCHRTEHIRVNSMRGL
jgi:hypothetical protein